MNSELIEKSWLFNHQQPPTKTAFAAARSKILILFFIHLFYLPVNCFISEEEATDSGKVATF